MQPSSTTTVTDTRHRVGVYGWSGGSGGVHHHRIGEPLRVLKDLGQNVSTGVTLDDDILSTVDTILVDKLHDPRASEAWQRLARLGSHRLVIDVDDWMWAPDWAPFRDSYTPETLERLYDNIRVAHVVTTPSPVIAEHLLRYNRNVWYVPNTVPAWLLEHTMPAREHPTVGYQGSPSHVRDWTTGPTKGLIHFLYRNPDWRLHTYGGGLPGGAPQWMIDQTTHHQWAQITDYYRTVSMDVGIGPLRDTPFNRAKSGLRAIEYAALGIVAVLPDHPIYRPWVADGVTGALIKSHQTFGGVLAEVARQDAWRAEAAANARRAAASWTTEAAIGSWVEAWHSR